MQFKDQVDFIRRHIKKNKLRVFMTVLAATMGTAFLIVLASVGFGLHETLRDEVQSNRIITEIQVHASDESKEPSEQVGAFKEMAHVKAVVNRQRINAIQHSRLGEYTGSHEIVVTDFTEEARVGFALKEGRLPEKANEVVVGSDFGASMYLEMENENDEFVTYDGDLIGQQFIYQIGDYQTGNVFDEEIPFTIVGVGEYPAKDWQQDRSIYADRAMLVKMEEIYDAHIEEKQEDFKFIYNNVTVYADKVENVSTLANELKEEGYWVYSIADELKQMDVFFLALKAGLIFVGTIAILIASIGIFNTMTMAVTERTREIGVMKAIGANPKLIQRLFLMESAWIGIVGTLLAVAISYAVSTVANYLLPIIVAAALGEEDLGGMNVTFSVIPWQLVLIASAISIGVAMISGWRPARKATKIDVINALRQEL
ncbi:ABC transporter permease [Sporosarcina sp. HYO08]|uniref:ABC transporter permease n=1 Tax=Sporosarcina sp. HYO08 TaxID=1759557 RepID=UPI00079948B0|nr:ABC transporter permease [Sporosarcina sp. HYO08]KXH80888.1 macrolide ABC transporter permease [Sporosarcina sp. HYO08]